MRRTAITPRKQLTRANLDKVPSTPRSQKVRLNGLIKDGVWYCNCEPRAKAQYLEVKKDSPNKGRWFWGCFKCNFFLWSEEAHVREGGVTMEVLDDDDDDDVQEPDSPSKGRGNGLPSASQYQASLSRFGFGPVAGPDGDDVEGSIDIASMTTDERLDMISLAGQASEMPVTPSSRLRTPTTPVSRPMEPPPAPRLPGLGDKRKRSEEPTPTQTAGRSFGGDGGEDVDLLSELSSDEERVTTEAAEAAETAEAAERSAKKLQAAAPAPAPGGPSVVLGNPNRGKTVAFTHDIPSPITGGKTQGFVDAETRVPLSSSSQPSSPLAGRTASTSRPSTGLREGGLGHDDLPSNASVSSRGLSSLVAGVDDANAMGEEDDYAIASQVLSLLDGQPLGPGVRAAVRDTLNRYALRVRGVERGRDLVRSALTKKDAKVAQLQDRVAVLENLYRAEQDSNKRLWEGINQLRSLAPDDS